MKWVVTFVKVCPDIWSKIALVVFDFSIVTGTHPNRLTFLSLYSDLKKKANSVKNSKAKIELLGSYDPEKQLIIKDPYYVSLLH